MSESEVLDYMTKVLRCGYLIMYTRHNSLYHIKWPSSLIDIAVGTDLGLTAEAALRVINLETNQ